MTEPAEDGNSLAAALLPHLLHAVNNTTQLLGALSAVADVDRDVLEERADDLAAAARESRDHGWLLGVLAAELGADVLLARRESDGLRPMVALVRHALRKEGRDLSLPERLPQPAPDVGRGWELPWALGAVLLGAGRDAAPGERLDWSLRAVGEEHALEVAAPLGAGGRAAVARAVERLPGLELREGSGAWSLRLPGPWLRSC